MKNNLICDWHRMDEIAIYMDEVVKWIKEKKAQLILYIYEQSHNS